MNPNKNSSVAERTVVSVHIQLLRELFDHRAASSASRIWPGEASLSAKFTSLRKRGYYL